MATEYRIIATMIFNNAADRNEWYDAIKTSVVNAKPTKPAYTAAHMTKDEYERRESPATEAV